MPGYPQTKHHNGKDANRSLHVDEGFLFKSVPDDSAAFRTPDDRSILTTNENIMNQNVIHGTA